MKKLLLTIGLMCVLLVVLTGCIRTTTDEGVDTFSIDPNSAAKVEAGVEASIGVMTVLSAFLPVLVPVVVGLGGVLGTWKKMKPALIRTQAEAELYYNTTAAIVTAIEDYKKDHPDDWEKSVEKYLVKAIGPNALNVIRALRNLPPKE